MKERARWYHHPEHGYMLRHNDSVVTGLCSHTAEDQETVTEWQAHKSRLYVNAGSGAIVADYMPRYAAHNPEFIPVQCGRVPAHIRKEFMQYV